MVKYYCDRCGRETPHLFEAEVDADAFGNRRDRAGLCDICASKVSFFMKNTEYSDPAFFHQSQFRNGGSVNDST